MTEKTHELKLCPDCGSTEYMENYPTPGTSICHDCGHEITSIVLKELNEEIERVFFARRKCSSCGLQDPAEESLLDDFSYFRVVVYKCKRCGKLDGYRIVPETGALEETDDGDFSGKAVVIAKTEGQFPYSAPAAQRLAKALKQKERDPLEQCEKTFKQFVEQKSLKMLEMKVASLTIGRATWKVNNYLKEKGPITDKQLELLFSAAIALAQDELSGKGQLKGERLTERQIAEIFSADRNTTRKWRALLKDFSPSY